MILTIFIKSTSALINRTPPPPHSALNWGETCKIEGCQSQTYMKIVSGTGNIPVYLHHQSSAPANVKSQVVVNSYASHFEFMFTNISWIQT